MSCDSKMFVFFFKKAKNNQFLMQMYLSFDTNVHGLFDFVLGNYKQAMQGKKWMTLNMSSLEKI